MKLGWILGILAALVVHAAIMAFGGIFFLHDEKDHGTLQQVELLTEEDAAPDKEKDKPEDVRKSEDDMQAEEEEAPDAQEMIRNLELSAVNDAPALDAASLGAIEQALSGGVGGGDFSDALSFSSGGRIGGTGKASVLEDKLEDAFNLNEIDQKPRAIFQAAPLYPSEMRGKKVEGTVTVIFVVDASGKVSSPRVRDSSNPAFEKPALDAVKQWKFEPAIKGGQRVSCKMRVPLRFQPS
jgi:protein TonB